jgi:hypothetical protein
LLGGRLYDKCAVRIILGISGYRLGEGLVENMDRVAAPPKMVGTGIFPCVFETLRTGFSRRRLIMRTSAAMACRFFDCDPTLSSLLPLPHGRLESHMIGLLLASAVSKGCFPVVLPNLQRPPPTQIRPYPRRRQTTPHTHVPPVDMKVRIKYPILKRNTGLAEREILMTLVYILYFEKPFVLRLPDNC